MQSYRRAGQKSPSTSAMSSGHAPRALGSASKRADRGTGIVGSGADAEADTEVTGALVGGGSGSGAEARTGAETCRIGGLRRAGAWRAVRAIAPRAAPAAIA